MRKGIINIGRCVADNPRFVIAKLSSVAPTIERSRRAKSIKESRSSFSSSPTSQVLSETQNKSDTRVLITGKALSNVYLNSKAALSMSVLPPSDGVQCK